MHGVRWSGLRVAAGPHAPTEQKEKSMMTLIRREPSEFPTMSRFWNQFFNEPFANGAPAVEAGNLALDLSEDDKSVIVRASLPGFRPEDIDVEIHDGVLSLKAERAEESEEKGETYYRRERRSGTVSRRITLPSVVEDSEATADLKDGVLTLRIAKSPKAMPRKVKIG
jgi:HSP20 family protein